MGHAGAILGPDVGWPREHLSSSRGHLVPLEGYTREANTISLLKRQKKEQKTKKKIESKENIPACPWNVQGWSK